MCTLCSWIVAAVSIATLPSAAIPFVERQAPPAASADARYDALVHEVEQATKAWGERYAAAKTDMQRRGLDEKYPPRVAVPRFIALAEQHPGTDVALRALTFAVVHGEEAQGLSCLPALEKDFLKSPELAQICPCVTSLDPRAQAFLLRAMGDNPHREVKGQACYALAQIALCKAEHIPSADGSSKELALRAEELLVQVTKTYADLPHPGGTLGKAAESDLFELRELTIGKIAPDILGEDVDGAAFKLSDHRGKVVVLFFWGNWCFPCRSLYHPLRSLTQRLADQPFALIGVNSDADRGALGKVLKAQDLTWRSFWDGGGESPGSIATRWNVKEWPTLYVLDHEGRIRFKNLYLDELDRALDTLLQEVPSRPR